MVHWFFLCSILTSEFMRISIHDTGEIDVLILSAANIRGSISSNGNTGEEVSLIRYWIEDPKLWEVVDYQKKNWNNDHHDSEYWAYAFAG